MLGFLGLTLLGLLVLLPIVLVESKFFDHDPPIISLVVGFVIYLTSGMVPFDSFMGFLGASLLFFALGPMVIGEQALHFFQGIS